ncbi:MAG: putative Ig domain-containing protein [Thermoguttaceae bacterium]
MKNQVKVPRWLRETPAHLVGIIPLLLASLALAAAETGPPPTAADRKAAIRTPPPPPTPRINGPRIFGARPGHPFIYHIPATGEKPISYAAQGLPKGLSLDEKSGIITGRTAEKGNCKATFTATNAKGRDTAAFEIVIGDAICLTPPMGWNSWNYFGGRVDQKKVNAAAEAMVAAGLIDHGWTYVNIDDCWEGTRDEKGFIRPNVKFPDMKGLSDAIHGMGLKFGIYSSPGPKTCAGFEASFEHEDQDAQTYAQWGVDYVKYDWCSYGGVAGLRTMQKYIELLPDQAGELKKLGNEKSDIEKLGKRKTPEQQAKLKELNQKLNVILAKLDPDKKKQIDADVPKAPYRLFGESLKKVDRDIVYSLCQYGGANVWAWGPEVGGNCWRTTGDIGASWGSVSGIGFRQNDLAKWAGPGHWNDPDMLEVGNGNLTPDENYTHMTLWCMLAAPLLIGCDMTKMDEFVLSLHSNDEVLSVDQDALGKQGYRVKQDGATEAWMKPLADGTLAVALFNRGDKEADVSVAWTELKLEGEQAVRDLWRQKDLDRKAKELSAKVARHGAELFRVGTPKNVRNAQ